MRDFQKEFNRALSLENVSEKNQRAIKDGLGLEVAPKKQAADAAEKAKSSV